MLRVVLDPGVYVSALLADGPPARLVEPWRSGAFDIVISPSLRAELASVLNRPKFRGVIDATEIDDLLAGLDAHALTVVDAEPASRTADPKDDYLVALVDAGSADVLVSGDAHLAPFALTPREFLERYLA